MPTRPRILLLSAYDAMSHRYWRKGLVAAFPEYDWTVLSLPARHFAWRLRGNSLSWALGERETLSKPYDLLLATSMTDLSALKGLAPNLARTPTLVYFHENQFAYPASKHQFASVEPQVLNLYTALAADRVLFNSHYNRNTFLQGVAALLDKLPDCVPEGVVDQLAGRSGVLPVPLSQSAFLRARQPSLPEVDWGGDANALKIIWAARWEFDKGPAQLLALLRELDRRDVNFRLALVGQSFRNSPKEFEQIGHEFEHRLAQFGYVESLAEFQAWQATADVVLSTALHEFQGLAVLEAISAGCIPVLPEREVYPELVDAAFLYACDLACIEQEAANAADRLQAFMRAPPSAPDVRAYSMKALKARYQQEISLLLNC